MCDPFVLEGGTVINLAKLTSISGGLLTFGKNHSIYVDGNDRKNLLIVMKDKIENSHEGKLTERIKKLEERQKELEGLLEEMVAFKPGGDGFQKAKDDFDKKKE